MTLLLYVALGSVADVGKVSEGLQSSCYPRSSAFEVFSCLL
jgi:hypothetical protein